MPDTNGRDEQIVRSCWASRPFVMHVCKLLLCIRSGLEGLVGLFPKCLFFFGKSTGV